MIMGICFGLTFWDPGQTRRIPRYQQKCVEAAKGHIPGMVRTMPWLKFEGSSG